MFLLRITLPSVLGTTLRAVSAVFAPLSMIMIGMTIAGVPLLSVISNKRTYFIAFFRLIIVPCIVMVFLKTVGMVIHVQNTETILTIVLFALITPAASTITQLAQLNNAEPDYCSAINVMTTLLCIVTMPLIIAVWGMIL